MTLLKITGGRIFDPVHNEEGTQRDVWIRDGRIVSSPTSAEIERSAPRVIDARGLVVMPGGVDMHCHIAGSKVNAARKLQPEDHRHAPPQSRTALKRSGTAGSVPSTFTTGYLYAGLGYTTAFDAAVPPLLARHAHEELEDTPILDKGFYVLLGNNHYVMERLAAGDHEGARNFIGWLINATKAFTAKVVNPGGVEVWKSSGGTAKSLDDSIDRFAVTPREILQGVARCVDELHLPHSVHVHCNQLGMPGNWKTTLQTMQALEGHRGHITHIQFHSYGGDADAQETFCSKVPDLVEYINAHDNLTVDVGQVVFGDTTSMTGDGPLGHYLHRLLGRKWVSSDLEMEAGCGIVPITYKNKSQVHALQWAIGLEWYLLMQDPWRIAMSTDHPNGGSFLAYPQIIALLMDRERRREMIAQLPVAVREQSVLNELDREYTLSEIAIITRAAPAKILGLKNKGHLGPGADADLTLYQPGDDLQRMFEFPRYVIHHGEVVIDDGELRATPQGTLLHAAPDYDDAVHRPIRDWFESRSTIQFDNYHVGLDSPRRSVSQATDAAESPDGDRS